MNWKLVFMCVMLFGMFAVGVLAQDAQADIVSTICVVKDLVMAIGGVVGVIAIAVVGIMMMYTTDPAEKNQLKTRLGYIIIGTILIVVAPMLMDLFGLTHC